MNPTIPLALAIAISISTGCDAQSTTTDRPSTNRAATMPAPQPAASQPNNPKRILGLDEGWELAPTATYSATQSAGTVTITATGEHPTAGYEIKLVPSPLRIWPPQHLLAHKKPDGLVAQIITPFTITATFKSSDPIKEITITDAAGKHEVTVEQK